MAKKSYIYILNWTEVHGCIKIGKANNIWNRYQQLKKGFGEADLENSYWFEERETDILQIEKLLHTFTRKYKVDFPEKLDGSTELFEIEALDEVRDLCGRMEIQLHKGINAPKNKVVAQKSNIKIKNEKTFQEQIEVNRLKLNNLIDFIRTINEHPRDWVVRDTKSSFPWGHRFILTTVINENPNSDYKMTVDEFREFQCFNFNESSWFSLINLFSYFKFTKDRKLVGFELSSSTINKIENLIEGNENLSLHIKQYYFDLFSQLISELRLLLSKKENSTFDVEQWLNPKFEWNSDEHADTDKFGVFNLLKYPDFRTINLKLEVSKISKIISNGYSWTIFPNNTAKTIKLFQMNPPTKEDLHTINNFQDGIYISDEENYFKFCRFLRDLFEIEEFGYEYLLIPKNKGPQQLPLYNIEDLF
ncbi:GIY-YIG nuclease family protein [Streptococcus ferus]|uniref:T5orf172 domain n=1 Tax=Streptococcus ferus TaxID=1345 RepID=A0A2X3W7B3_9STRE|nr:GIY-YIG nuclease family protein [Streptococcus ferus]SQF40216.1 T5orf172 domain [Streptococcus ferus]